jgi:subtilase family serine protease
MSSARLRPLLLALALLSPAVLGAATAANWQPDAGDWVGYRRDAAHTGATTAKGAFSLDLADLRIKWQRADDPGYWVPPTAADLDNDGVAEIVAVVGNASADPTNLQSPVNLESGLNVLNGATGAMKWSVAPETGYLDFYSPALGDIDGDGLGEIVYLHGNPLSGTSLTNKVVAYEHNGVKKWEWSDTNWGGRTPLPLTAMTIGDVDGESGKNEVVFTLFLAVVTTTVPGKVQIAGSNPEYRLIALNGEGSSAQKSWERVFTGKATGSNVALHDLDGDGTLDMVYGVGVKSGVLFETASARITATAEFEDDKLRGWYGGASPTEAFTHAFPGWFPGELGTAPAIADLDGDGKVEVVQPMWLRNFPMTPAEQSIVVVYDPITKAEKWRTPIAGAIAATIAQVPPAIGDLDGDGKKDIVVQVADGAAVDRFRLIALRHDGTIMWRSPSTGLEMTSAPVIGDITGDGKPEVLAAFGTNISFTRTATLLVYNGQTGAEVMRKAFEPGATVGGPLLVDLDGDDDGRLEVLVNIGSWGRPGKLIALEPELPDLRLTDLAFSAAEHLHGVAETVSAKVANLGSRTATGALVRFTDGSAVLHEATLTLAPGAEQTVSFPWTPATVGSRTIKAEADPGKGMAEWAENNNAQQRTIQVRAPDLRFAASDPAFSDGTPGVGDTITVSATLSNVGGKDAQGVLVRFLDGASVFHTTTVDLAKGASLPLSAQLLVEGEFDRDVAFVADPLDAIVEEDEANNRASKLLDVIFIAPDLTLADLGFSNPTPGADDVITVQAQLRNIGTKDAPSGIVVRFLDEGSVFAEQTLAGLAEGATTVVAADLLVVGEFVHTIQVQVDPLNAINEEREDNNALARDLHVLAPDLTIAAGGLALSDPNPDEGDVLTVTASVRNAGTGGKVPRDVLVRLLDEGTEVAQAVVASVAPGSSASVDLTYAVQGLGPRTLRVEVDPFDAIGESDDGNNAATIGVVVGKVKVALAMGKNAYGFQEQASGVATLTFRNSGKPVANTEFTVPIDYMLRTTPSTPPTAQAVEAVLAVLAQAGGASVQSVHVCSLGRCLDASVDLQGALAQLVGTGGGASGEGSEVRFRLFTIQAKTNALGQAGFVVPYSLLASLDALDAKGAVDACVSGVALPPEAPASPPSCAAHVGSVPALPAAANLPGRYRATGAISWHGFGFQGATEWNHV